MLLTHHFLDYRTYTVPYLASSMLRVNVSGHWKPGMEDFLGIIYWSLQQVVKILIFRHILVTWFTPLGYGLGTGGRKKFRTDPPIVLRVYTGFSEENVPSLASSLLLALAWATLQPRLALAIISTPTHLALGAAPAPLTSLTIWTRGWAWLLSRSCVPCSGTVGPGPHWRGSACLAVMFCTLFPFPQEADCPICFLTAPYKNTEHFSS